MRNHLHLFFGCWLCDPQLAYPCETCLSEWGLPVLPLGGDAFLSALVLEEPRAGPVGHPCLLFLLFSWGRGPHPAVLRDHSGSGNLNRTLVGPSLSTVIRALLIPSGCCIFISLKPLSFPSVSLGLECLTGLFLGEIIEYNYLDCWLV